jgi:hypothetical protein
MQTEKPHLRPTMMVHNNTTGILSEIECNGMPINVPVLETMGTTYKAKLEEIDFNLRDMLKVACSLRTSYLLHYTGVLFVDLIQSRLRKRDGPRRRYPLSSPMQTAVPL